MIPAVFNMGKNPPTESKFSTAAVRRRVLQAELEQAVIAEEYERAAEIRDMLALSDKEGGKDSSPG
jgi:protein-arginine kinase activator protein McsA